MCEREEAGGGNLDFRFAFAFRLEPKSLGEAAALDSDEGTGGEADRISSQLQLLSAEEAYVLTLPSTTKLTCVAEWRRGRSTALDCFTSLISDTVEDAPLRFLLRGTDKQSRMQVQKMRVCHTPELLSIQKTKLDPVAHMAGGVVFCTPPIYPAFMDGRGGW